MTPAKKTGFPAAGILAALLPLAGVVSLPFYFIYSDVISSSLARVLRLAPEPALSGGALAARFPDPLGDDAGSGSLEPPGSPFFGEGELDLVSYTVRSPLTRSVWADGASFWQLEVRFAKAVPLDLPGGGFRSPGVHIYLDLDGAASGSLESAFGEGELVRFDPRWPWDYAVTSNSLAGSGEILSADGSYRDRVEQFWNAGDGRLILRINLLGAPSLLESVLDGRETAHYVLAGARDDAREGGFASVREHPNLHSGGGARDEFTPWVYDILAPQGVSQAALLSSQDAASGRLAQVEPVVVRREGSRDTEGARSVPGLRSRLEAQAHKEAEAAEQSRSTRLAALPAPDPGSDAALLEELFDLGLQERCRAAVDAALARDSRDLGARAYRGALTALRADKAQGVAEKMRLVEEAYRDLDAAAGAVLAEGSKIDPATALSVLLCRANVSVAVPDSVFRRAAQGAADFDAAARRAGNPRLQADYLAGAARAYEKAGLPEDAGVRWATLAGFADLSASVRLELLDRGYSTLEDARSAPFP